MSNKITDDAQDVLDGLMGKRNGGDDTPSDNAPNPKRGAPKKAEENKSIPKTFTLTQDTLNTMNKQSRADGVKSSQLIRAAILAFANLSQEERKRAYELLDIKYDFWDV
ncbi:TPA: hypothetical protein ACF35N_004505 [Vibrio parahaemolyticus]